jgi:hypothetical protein
VNLYEVEVYIDDDHLRTYKVVAGTSADAEDEARHAISKIIGVSAREIASDDILVAPDA